LKIGQNTDFTVDGVQNFRQLFAPNRCWRKYQGRQYGINKNKDGRLLRGFCQVNNQKWSDHDSSSVIPQGRSKLSFCIKRASKQTEITTGVGLPIFRHWMAQTGDTVITTDYYT
jgi:hypothetical protein